MAVAPAARVIVALALGALAAACDEDTVWLGGGPPEDVCGERCFVDHELQRATADWFYGKPAAENLQPEIVYPLDESTHPEGLQELTVQWRRFDRAQRFHRLRFSASALAQSYEFYVPCLATVDEGCRYTLAADSFLQMSAAFRGQDVELTVTSTEGPGRVVATSAAAHLRFTPHRLENKGFYYWGKASDEVGVTYRLAFGARRPDVFIHPTEPLTCTGCHTLSADGSTIAYTGRTPDASADQRTGHLVVSFTSAPTTELVSPGVDYDSSMMALSDDGMMVLVAYDNQLVLRHAGNDPARGISAGDVVAAVPSEMLGASSGYFPEFSPNSDALALTVSSEPDTPHAVKAGSIAVMTYDHQVALGAPPGTPSESIFGAAQVIVPGDERWFYFYPTWSPDGEYIAFVRAPRGDGSISYNQKNAELMLVARGGGPVYELMRATQGAGNWSTLPKFAPFPPSEQGGLMFLTYNSKIDYGLLLRNSSFGEGDRYAQLWMAAIDVTKLPGDDPSSAPVWLPFQNFTHQSHFGYWTREVKCRTDAEPGCGPDEECVNGLCLVTPH